jgi:hypothetical protein
MSEKMNRLPPEYEDFVLEVNGTTGDYTVEARGPGEISIPPAPFEYQETDELRVELNRIKEGFAPTRERMQFAGQLLFDALFPRKVVRAFENARAALSEGVELRLKLIVRPAELSHLPWELMYDPDEEAFPAARLSCPIVRFIESGKPVAKLLARRPLRVLYVQANPPGTNPLDTLPANEKALRKAFGETPGEDAEVTPVRNARQQELQDRLREPYHILYYDGHAVFDAESDAGYLYLHDGRLSGELLGRYYLDNTSIRLVVLSACETAVDSKEKRFSGIAHQLMLNSKLPAVVAMQYSIPERSASAFTGEFFRALADGYPVDAATVEGRKAILRELKGDPFAAPDWATPVLFMRVNDGYIFREEITEDETMSEPKEPREKGVTIGGRAHVRVGGSIVGGNQIAVSGSTINIAGRNLFQGPIANKQDLVEQLQKLREELDQVVKDEEIDGEEAMIADVQIKAAISNAQKSDPDPDKISQRLNRAKEIIEKATVGAGAAVGLVTAISRAVELVGQFFL